MAAARQYCTFVVADLFFGVEVMSIQEVIRYQKVTRVPLASAEIEGLINLRGQIVTAFDMRRLLDLTPREADRLPMNVVLTAEHGGVSLLVDEIGDVIEVSDDAFEPVPDTLASDVRECLTGVYKLADRLLLILDTQRIVARVQTRGRAA